MASSGGQVSPLEVVVRRASQGRLDEQEIRPANGVDDRVARSRVTGVGEACPVGGVDDDAPRGDVVPSADESDRQGTDGEPRLRIELRERERRVEEARTLGDRGR